MADNSNQGAPPDIAADFVDRFYYRSSDDWDSIKSKEDEDDGSCGFDLERSVPSTPSQRQEHKPDLADNRSLSENMASALWTALSCLESSTRTNATKVVHEENQDYEPNTEEGYLGKVSKIDEDLNSTGQASPNVRGSLSVAQHDAQHAHYQIPSTSNHSPKETD